MSNVIYEFKTCPVCGVHYAVDEIVMNYRENRPENADDRHWFCPNGHRLIFRASLADQYRHEAERLRQRIAEKDDEIADRDRQIVAAKGQITKLNKRVAAGVCPCCTRSFTNLRRHIATKHPDYGNENVVPFKAEIA